MKLEGSPSWGHFSLSELRQKWRKWSLKEPRAFRNCCSLSDNRGHKVQKSLSLGFLTLEVRLNQNGTVSAEKLSMSICFPWEKCWPWRNLKCLTKFLNEVLWYWRKPCVCKVLSVCCWHEPATWRTTSLRPTGKWQSLLWESDLLMLLVCTENVHHSFLPLDFCNPKSAPLQRVLLLGLARPFSPWSSYLL